MFCVLLLQLCIDFIDAVRADVAAFKSDNVFSVAAKDAGRLVFLQNQHVAFHSGAPVKNVLIL